MEPVSQLLLRSRPALGDGPLLLLEPPPDSLYRELQAPDRPARLSTASHGACRRLQALGADVSFETHPPGPERYRHVVLIQPREKDRLAMLLHAAVSRLEPGGRLWLAGAKRSGIQSAGKLLARYFANVGKRDAARHCALFEGTGPLPTDPFDLDAYERRWQVTGGALSLVSLPGVFARQRLDPGTAMLLETFAGEPPTGRILDFGCGCGVIAVSLLAAGAEGEAWLLDDSALALEASRRSLDSNGLQGRLLASDGLGEVDGRFDWIISNPPFHRGIEQDLGVAEAFFRQAGTFLTENGRIRVVFNRHLPYAAWLRKSFNRVDCLASNRSFTVLQASKAR